MQKEQGNGADQPQAAGNVQVAGAGKPSSSFAAPLLFVRRSSGGTPGETEVVQRRKEGQSRTGHKAIAGAREITRKEASSGYLGQKYSTGRGAVSPELEGLDGAEWPEI